MRWILGAGEDIVVDKNQLISRSDYIKCVTGVSVSNWNYIRINGKSDERFLCCMSNDNVNGAFITAHINDLFTITALQQVHECRIIIANTCIWNRLGHKKLLYDLRRNNSRIELYFAKQELSIDRMQNFRQTTTIKNVGQFGFQTSLSERELFINRQAGFEEALGKSFERVSPILFLGD